MFRYTTIKNFLSEEECNSILNFSLENLSISKAFVGKHNYDESIRNSEVGFYKYESEFPYLRDKILTEIHKNVEIKGYNIEFTEPFQFTKYGQNQFYNWHKDADSELDSYNRYCSIVIQLNNEYEGGELELLEKNEIIQLEKNKGNLFIFLSSTTHRVKPVTEGTRYSLVNWFGIEKIDGYKKTLI